MVSRRELCQAIALATHATEFLSEKNEPNNELLIRHFAFSTLHDLSFERKASANTHLIACTTLSFMRRLKSEESGPVRLWMSGLTGPRHDDATWGILTDTEMGLYVWTPRWMTRSFSPSDATPHRVRYVGSRITRWQLGEQRPLREDTERLLVLLAQYGLCIMPSGIECPCPQDAPDQVRVGVDVALATTEYCAKNWERATSRALWPLAIQVIESAANEYATHRLRRTPVG